MKNSDFKIDNPNAPVTLSLSKVIQTEWKWWLLGAIFAFFLASVLASGWPTGLLPNLDYPFTYNNDGAFGTAQRLIEGWYYDNARSGYPFGSNMLDYPSSDSGSYLVMKLLGVLTPEWHKVHNLYFLLGFAVDFIATYWVLRAIGLTIPFAITASSLFNFLPFHFQRMEHLAYTWYFVVPIVYYIALNFRSLSIGANENLSRKILYLLCLLGLGSFGIYYALFAMIIFVTVAGYEAIADYHPKALRAALFATFMVFLGVILNLSPNLIHQFTDEPNLEVAQRGLADSEVYGFKFAQLVLPRLGHRNEHLSKLSNRYASEAPLVNENRTATLGAAGTLGLLAAFAIIVVTLAGRSQNKTLIISSLMVLVLFMFGTIGGFGEIFALTITKSIRGWNRISIFIGFGVLLVLFLLIQIELQKRMAGRRLLVVSSFISIIFLLGGYYDQTVSACQSCNEQTNKMFSADRSFIHAIEKSLPAGSAIYQLPYMQFPEVPPLHRLQAYDLAVGFLHSTSLHWSYGGMKGRPGDLFYRSLAKESISKQIEVIKRLGFAGIYVDRRGFDDNDHTVIDGLTALLGSPSLSRADGEVVFFSLHQDAPQINLDGQSADELMKRANYIVDRLGVRYEATLSNGIDFTRSDFPTFIKDVNGLSGSEAWGRWSDANLAPSVRIDFLNQLPNHFNLKFSAQPFGPNVDQDLLVRLGSQQLHFKFQAGQLEYQLPIDLKGEKVTCIEFLPPKPTSPKQIGLSPDPRMLGVGLTYLRFKENDTL